MSVVSTSSLSPGSGSGEGFPGIPIVINPDRYQHFEERAGQEVVLF